MIKTVKFRIKDSNKKVILDQMARDVKFVWNVLNSAARKKWKESRKHFHKFDPWFNQILNGASKELSINSETIHSVRDQFHKDIRQHKKHLRFKGKRSLKWIPFKKRTFHLKNGYFNYKGARFNIWQSMIIKGEIKCGSITMDVTGRWFVNITYESEEKKQSFGKNQVGIDLGIKTTATCSDGRELKVNDLKKMDKEIARQQRARNFKRVKALQVKKTNIKNDRFNKFVLDLVKTNNLMAIGNVKGFTKGKIAKSRYLNSWSTLKRKLEYKCEEYQIRYLEVDERFTTQQCNKCGSIEGPKGVKELGVRSWVCGCGARLSRDINAAINILDRAKSLAS